ncbi:MAG TPA: protein kinase [Kofleriaceae bacterium]|nr:protein kinase [Kofleriaceae bacterium]
MTAGPERARKAGPRPEVDGFELGEPLGVGGAGAVWAARDRDGRDAAIKVAHTADDSWRVRFAGEASALAALGPPHAPQLFAQDVLSDGRSWIAMERMSGSSLADEMADMASAPPFERGLRLADALLAAVAAMHGRGFAHGDITPENVFFRPTQSNGDHRIAVLIDFGLATGGGAPAGGWPGWITGTLGYMAPEVLAGGPGGPRADVYALGAILYELFTLRPPFAGDASELERSHLAVRPRPPGLVADLPRVIDELILSCLAKDPGRRPPDAAAARRALADTARMRPVTGPVWTAATAPPVNGATPNGGDRAELVALLWFECDAGLARITAEIARARGALARQRGRTCLAVFGAGLADNPARAALAAASRLLATWGGHAALHVDRVILRERDGRPTAPYGSPVDRPEEWLPAEPWAGLVLTRAMADAVGDLAVVPAEPRGFFAPAGARVAPAPPLSGRASLVSALAAGARASFSSGRPGLGLLLGGPGSGKSRVLSELAAMAHELGAAHIVIDGSRPHATEGQSGELLRERVRAGPLAVLVDDAHLADDAFLDSLEYATLGGASAPLWVLVAADGPTLDQIRPHFGERAAQLERYELEPLGDDAMRELAASLLFPADYLPAAELDRLAALAGGNPGLLTELVRALKREGAVRPRPDRRSHELAVEAIERLPATAAGRWEASRALDGLPEELAASARVAAVFRPIIDEDELDAVADALEREGHGRFFDARVALRVLATRSLVVDRGGGAWAFASPLVQDAIYRAIPADERRRIHRHALAYWGDRVGSRAMAAVARHAGLAGVHEQAAGAALALAEAAAGAHREVEAERWFSAALLHIGDQATRVSALVGRGRARWRLDRGPEALTDLAAARVLAEQIGDGERVASILLDEAMVLDWFFDYPASAERVASARPLVEASGDAALRARLLVATARTCWRQERLSEALDLFAEGAALTLDGETRLVALLLRACALCCVDRLDEAEAVFAEVGRLADAMEDRLHRCALHVNRFFLWAARGDSERGADDLRRAVRLARELGQPGLERAATHNLAELLHLSGHDAEAHPLAIRSFELQQRYMPQPGPEDALLLGRIAVAMGDRETAARHLAWVEAHTGGDHPSRTFPVFHRALTLVQHGGTAEEWDAMIGDAAAAAMHPLERLEILYLRASCEIDAGRVEAARGAFAAARAYLEVFPAWNAQFEGLAARISR